MKQPPTLAVRRLIVLFSAVVITFVYWICALWYQHKTASSKELVVFHRLFGHLWHDQALVDLYQYYYQFALTVLLFVLLPWVITTYLLQGRLADMGLRWVYNRTAVLLCVVVYPLIIASTWFSSQRPEIVAEYPLSKLIGSSWWVFITYELAYGAYFISYEIFYRGYLQFGLSSRSPNTKETVYVLSVQTLLTTLFHIGKPGSEIMLAAVFGPIIGYVALKFRSVWYGAGIHYLMNVVMDYFILYHLQMLPSSFF